MHTSLILTAFFFLMACNDSQFTESKLAGGADAELSHEAPHDDTNEIQDGVIEANEPIMVGGAFLHCQPSDSIDMLHYHADCRLELDEQRLDLPENVGESFELRLTSNAYVTVDFSRLPSTSPWQWSVLISKDLDFTDIQLNVEQFDRRVSYVTPLSPDDFQDPQEIEAENIDVELSLSDYVLGPPPTIGFFVVGNSIMQSPANRDCSQETIDAATSDTASIIPQRSFSIEIPDGGAMLSIDIPRLCGVSPRSGEIDYNRVNVDHSNGERQVILLSAEVPSLIIMEDQHVMAGILTITVESRQISTSYSGYDTFAFWPIEVTSDRPIVQLP